VGLLLCADVPRRLPATCRGRTPARPAGFDKPCGIFHTSGGAPAPAGSKSLRCHLRWGSVASLCSRTGCVLYTPGGFASTPTCRGLMKLAENRFLSGPRACAGAVAANETCTLHTVGAATGGADFAGAIKSPGEHSSPLHAPCCAPHAFLTPRGSGSSFQRKEPGGLLLQVLRLLAA